MDALSHGMRRRRRRIILASAGVAAVIGLLAGAGQARAADRIYWANLNGGVPAVSFANLDGTGAGGDLNTAGGAQSASGLSLYPAGGKVYWGSTGFTISLANLDGSGGGGALNPAGQPVSSAQGPAIDPGAGRIYWPNSFMSEGIYFASLDGSGGGQVNTTGATVNSPIGVAVDPAAGRIYWANAAPTNKISFANLDGSGGGDINTTGATVDNPQGVAVDPGANRIYWANVFGQKISFAKLDGSGGGDLNTTGATVTNPAGVSVDAAAGRIYWASVLGGKVSFARLDNSGGGDLDTTGATTSFPNYPVILKAPTGDSAPQISESERTLSCSPGGWSADLIASFLYRAPSSFAFRWTQDGSEVAGANASSFEPSAAGNYRCQVTASNPAGSASQASDPFARFMIGKARRNRRRGTAKLPITVPDPGTLSITGRGVKAGGTRSVPAGTVKVLVKAKGRKRNKLEAKGRAKLMLSIAYAPAGFPPSTQTAEVRLRKR
jgi:DNA-binding beta-propeller fold protein YncE